MPRPQKTPDFAMVPVAVLAHPDLTSEAKIVYAVLAGFAYGSGECFPSNETIAAAGNLSVRSVQYRLRELAHAGLIEVRFAARNHREKILLLPIPEAREGAAEGSGRNAMDCTPGRHATACVPSRNGVQQSACKPQHAMSCMQEAAHRDEVGVQSSARRPQFGMQSIAPEEDTGRSEEEISGVCGDAGAGAGVADRNGEPIDLDCGLRPDPADVAKVQALAERLFPGTDFSAQISGFAGMYELDWIKQALEQARSWSDPPRSFTPIWNMLKRWARDGGPPKQASPRASPSSKPEPKEPPGGYFTAPQNLPRMRAFKR